MLFDYESGKELKKIIKENHDLPIVPIVSDDVCSDYGITLGTIGHCSVDQLAVSPFNDERFLIKDDDYEEFEDDYPEPVTRATIKAVYEGLEWKKCIVVYISAF